MLEDDFYRQLGESDYGKQYLALIESAKDRGLKPEKGYERHHIHSRALGGGNEDENLVKLTILEHCVAHYYLAKAIPCWKTLYPILKLSGKEVRDLSDLERLTLEEVCNWSTFKEQIAHMPKPPELVEKNRLGHLGKKLHPEQIIKRTAHRIGTWTVNKDGVEKFIKPEDWPEFEKNGWVRGRAASFRKNSSKAHTGLKGTCTGYRAIHMGETERKVKVEEVERYLAEGWQLGRADSFGERHRKAMELNNSTNIGRVRIKKDGKGKVVPKDELQSYLDQGWVLGIVRK